MLTTRSAGKQMKLCAAMARRRPLRRHGHAVSPCAWVRRLATLTKPEKNSRERFTDFPPVALFTKLLTCSPRR